MSIKIDQYSDPFTHHVYESIDPNVRATFTPRQVHAIETAIRANKPYQKHPVDLRGAFPLFFFRVYFVLLMGRDKRQPTRDKEAKRRHKAVIGSAILSLYVVVCMLIPVGIALLYVLKSFIGIDLIEGLHLRDLLDTA